MSGNDPAKLPTWQEVVTKMQFPALAGWQSDPQEFAVIRSLTAEETEMLHKWEEPFRTAEQRMNLLKIVHRNFRQLQGFLGEPDAANIDHRIELDRLILNYLSSAYGLHEQLRRHIKRRTRDEIAAFNRFIDRLEKQSFAFAFFRDFRNYVQHCELPVGKLTITRTPAKTIIHIRHFVRDLLQDSKEWKRSELHKRTGEIDLLALLREYNDVLFGDYANQIAGYFTRQLFPLDNFAQRLAIEVKAIKPTYRLVICTSVEGDGINKVNFTCQDLPEDVLGFLNIKLVRVGG